MALASMDDYDAGDVDAMLKFYAVDIEAIPDRSVSLRWGSSTAWGPSGLGRRDRQAWDNICWGDPGGPRGWSGSSACPRRLGKYRPRQRPRNRFDLLPDLHRAIWPD